MLFYNYNLPDSLIEKPAKRIVSLVPSLTEFLYDLELNDEVVGITKFCVHPEEWFRSKTRIGGTKNINIDKIISLQPDLVVANKEENVKEQIAAIGEHFPVYISEVSTVIDALQTMEIIGQLTGRLKHADVIIQRIKESLNDKIKLSIPKTCTYLIWKDPYMTVGRDTFINDMLTACGFINVFAEKSRYPEIDLSQLKADFILLSSEPYPFKQKNADEFKCLFPESEILLVDGQMFSWYGSRMKYARDYFNQLLDQYR